MEGFLVEYGSEIIASIIGAIIGAGISIPITLKVKSSKDTAEISQQNIKAGRDNIGRDRN